MSADEEFEAIANEAIEKADAVKCDVETYRSGLRGIIDNLNTALQASQECDG